MMRSRLENASTIEKEAFRKKVHKEQKKKSTKMRFYHSFLTIVLLFCILQMSWSALLNISKIVMYKGKIYKSMEIREKAKVRNEKLKNELNNYNSMQKVEQIARNNLKMAAEGEVLVIINRPEMPVYAPSTPKEKLLYWFSENVVKQVLKKEGI